MSFVALICTSVVHQARAQEELPQRAAVSGQSSEQLSIVQWVKPKTPGVLNSDVFHLHVGGELKVHCSGVEPRRRLQRAVASETRRVVDVCVRECQIL